jgi:hypothetical protein
MWGLHVSLCWWRQAAGEGGLGWAGNARWAAKEKGEDGLGCLRKKKKGCGAGLERKRREERKRKRFSNFKIHSSKRIQTKI